MLPPVLLVPKLSEGADRVGGQLRGDNGAFCGVTNSGRVWRKVPESNARSVVAYVCAGHNHIDICQYFLLTLPVLMSAPVITI